jgi:hypothetical protein
MTVCARIMVHHTISPSQSPAGCCRPIKCRAARRAACSTRSRNDAPGDAGSALDESSSGSFFKAGPMTGYHTCRKLNTASAAGIARERNRDGGRSAKIVGLTLKELHDRRNGCGQRTRRAEGKEKRELAAIVLENRASVHFGKSTPPIIALLATKFPTRKNRGVNFSTAPELRFTRCRLSC